MARAVKRISWQDTARSSNHWWGKHCTNSLGTYRENIFYQRWRIHVFLICDLNSPKYWITVYTYEYILLFGRELYFVLSQLALYYICVCRCWYKTGLIRETLYIGCCAPQRFEGKYLKYFKYWLVLNKAIRSAKYIGWIQTKSIYLICEQPKRIENGEKKSIDKNVNKRRGGEVMVF